MKIQLITTVLDLIGVFVSALLGGAVARTMDLDLFGYAVIGAVSGLGGGIIRDVLLQHGPPAALTNPWYVPTAMAGAGVAFLVKFSVGQWNRLFLALDAMAISVWAIAGAQKTLAAGLGWLPAVLLGTITAVGGGAARDLLIQRVPAVLGGNGLYASVAIVVAGIQVLCTGLGLPVAAGTVAGLVAGTLLRLIAVRRSWQLPSGMPWEAGDVFAWVARTPPPAGPPGRPGPRDGDAPGDGSPQLPPAARARQVVEASIRNS